MSLRTPFYGGFPGPPDQASSSSSENRPQSSSARQRPHNFHQSPNAPYAGNGLNPMFPGHNAPGYLPQSMNFPYSGNQFVPNLYFNTGTEFYPNQSEYFPQQGYSDQYHVVQQPHHFSPTSNIPPYPDSFLQMPNDDSKSNEGMGKSRRFSRQRTAKDTNTPGSSGEMVSQSQERSDAKSFSAKQQPKGPIRFSHQKENGLSNTKKETKSKYKLQSRSPDGEHCESSKEAFKASQSKLSQSKDKTEKMLRPKSRKISMVNADQASLLHDQLSAGTYECMVCCDRIKQFHAVWNCPKCFNLFHMVCIKKWARSPVAKVNENDVGWRCPGCQNVTKQVPNTYYCFCGKVRDPEWKKGEMPHSCGENCSKQRKDTPGCTHPCNILCHPGPCPQCPAMVNRQCQCGKLTSRIRCSQQSLLKCDKECSKFRNCGIHKCSEVCHSGKCSDCEETITQECFCGKHSREVVCGSYEHKASKELEGNGFYSCEEICNRVLECDNHHCEALCHEGKCKECPMLPRLVKLCPCTQTRLENLKNEDGLPVSRKSCLEPVPTCEKICGKPLECGGDEIHICTLTCHVGSCPPCTDQHSNIKCRCGKSEKDVACGEYVTMQTYVCDRRCNKKRKCGRHKCGQTCCTESEHVCMQICGRKLSCGIHRCDEPCHRGTCHACFNVSFDELRCYCGDKVTYPPIPCGTKAPECSNECTRMHPCTHPIRHTCHTEEFCPPCVELVKKPCNCGRVIRGNIMCHVDNVSCGKPCEKVLSCGHKCSKPCHKGSCGDEGAECKQPCSIMRSECIHPCANPCHYGSPCPNAPCLAMVTVKCPCGRREEQMECSSGRESYYGVRSAVIAGTREGEGIDIGNLLLRSGSWSTRALPCNEECSVYERNRRLAAALNVKDPDFSSDTKQQYSDFLKSMAKNDGAFVQTLEKDLTNLIDHVDWMGSPKKSHSFPSMRRDKRQAVHEMAEAFGCKSESRDEEPNRNVVVTATKGVSKCPNPLLSKLVLEKVVEAAKPFPSTKPTPSKGRLLSSMKLVSFKSEESSRDQVPRRAPPPTRKIQEKNIGFSYKPPSMRSSPNPLPLSTRFDVLSVSSSHHPQPVSTSSNLSPSAKAFVRSNQRDPVSTTPSQPQTSGSNKQESIIDYFDMTE